jgi:hypothetical protein
MRLLVFVGLLLPAAVAAQQVSVPYSGSAPYSGSTSVTVNVTGLPTGCVAGAPSYANGTITVPVNCGVIPPPVGTTCASSTTPVTGCTIGSTVAVVSNPGNVRGTPAAGGGNGPLMGTQPGGATGVIVSNPVPQTTPATGWQVVNFGTGTCNAAGPYSATCGYVGNNNLKPATAPPPTAPTVSCSPSSVQTGATSNCSGNQAIASWKASAGTITTAGVFTAPSTAQTVTITGTNANGSGTTPVTVSSSGPPITTCTTTLSPSGGQDNAALLAAISRAGSGCVELKAGTYNLSAWNPPTGTSLVLDDAVVIQDFGIFGRTTPFFSVTNKLSVVGAGPLYSAVVTMPTNYANAKKQVANGQDYEYQHCFALNGGVSGVVFSNFSLLNCAGDGVTFVSTSGATLTNINSATNIRQGMAVTGPATNVSITGGNLHDGPLSALDVEPDSGITGNIQMVINGLHSANNVGGGTSFGLMNLTASSNINIVDNNPTSTNDGGTAYAFWNGSNNTAPTGTVTVNNATSTGSGADCSYGQRSSVGYTVTFNNLTCINSNSKQSSGSNQTNTALGLQCNSCVGASPGGVQWLNTTITGGNGCISIPSNAVGVKVSGTCNGKPVSYP